jgi:hypothetical protein
MGNPTVTASPKSARTWVIVGFVFAGFYLLVGIFFLLRGPATDKYIGIVALVIGVLFAFGSLLALEQQYAAARVLWLIGGILGLPLGLVMVGGAGRLKEVSLAPAAGTAVSAAAVAVSAPEAVPPESELVPSMSFGARFIGVFVSPGETFEDIARRPGFIAPLIVAIVSGLAILETMIFKIGMERIVRQSLEQSGQAARMSAEQLERTVHTGATVATVIGHVGVVVIGPAMLLIMAALGLGILVLIYGAPAKFKAVFSATCYANLVSVLGVVMGVALILFGDPEHFNAQNPIPSNVGFFLNPLETSKPLYSLASSADILWIWTMILMAMGWSRVSGGKAKTVPVFLAFAGVWLIWVFGKMGFVAIFS